MALASRLFRLQRVVVLALAGLLVFYHTCTLLELYAGSSTDLYGGPDANGHAMYAHTQSILRIVIIVSLVLVAMNRRSALYGMWLGIGALVATHYWAYFFDLPFPFVAGRHPLSYLKGFIIPTVITLVHLSANSRCNVRQRRGS
jgi:Na+/proline symporter